MKIEKVKSRNYKGKQYYKMRIVLPEETLKQANFKPGDELEAEAKKGEIKLRKK
jgi:bifunctional DNA-binding transcriptional regulator/antitoxin component of YhaV-PrlF toxin-antitoxin module